ncbi:MAG: peptidoglycan-binding domain-containing protein [bacterium]
MTLFQLQRYLKILGYAPGSEDGRLGPITRRAVKRFQLDRGLLSDGIPGQRTEAAILAAIREDNAKETHSPRTPQPPRQETSDNLKVSLLEILQTKGCDLSRLNLVGVCGWMDGKVVENRWNEYNDTIYVVEHGKTVSGFRASVDPGRLREPNPKGTAHLLPGLYRYRLGLHRQRETALVQAGPVRVERFLDDVESGDSKTVEEGWFGINIHRGGSGSFVGEWSAGCQVIHGSEWATFLQFVLSAAAEGQRRFPYLLLNGEELTIHLCKIQSSEAPVS